MIPICPQAEHNLAFVCRPAHLGVRARHGRPGQRGPRRLHGGLVGALDRERQRRRVDRVLRRPGPLARPQRPGDPGAPEGSVARQREIRCPRRALHPQRRQ